MDYASFTPVEATKVSLGVINGLELLVQAVVPTRRRTSSNAN